eukprot:gene17755-29492_t
MRQVVQMLALLTGTCVAAPPTNRVCTDNADCGDRSWHCGAKGRCEQVRDEGGKDDVWLDQTTYHLVQSWSMIHGRNNVNLNSTLFQPSRGRRSSRRHLANVPHAARKRILERLRDHKDVSSVLQKQAVKDGEGPSSFHIDVAEYLLSASPAAVSLFHRVRMNLDSFGLAVTQHMMDEMRPGAGTGGFMECAREGAQCLPIPPCAAADGTYTVRYGLTARKTTTVKGITLPASCNVHTFKSDPVPGAPKNCWVECGAARALPVTTNAICPAVTAAPHASAGAKHRLPHVSDAEMHWATIPLCEEDVTTASGSVKEEAVLQEAIGLMCKHDTYKAAFKNVRLDCRFAAAYSRAIANAADTDVDGSRGAGGDSDSGRYQTVVHTAADYTTWIERAWVTYFKGTATGMNHVMMVSNLIRSAQMFSKYPLICVVFGQ